MNIIRNSIIGGVIIDGNKCVIDDKEYKLPNGKANNISVIDNNVFVDGYELINGKWKRTLRAFWHLWF